MNNSSAGSRGTRPGSSKLWLAIIAVGLGGLLTPTSAVCQPQTGHPRLFLRATDLPRLRSWAVNSNPIYRDGLAILAANAKQDMDAGRVPNQDAGTTTYVDYASEMYAELFAFLSLISSDQATRDDYAQRARTLLMYVINRAAQGAVAGQPFRDPEFATNDRSRWQGEGFALTVDWIYSYLSAADKATIRQVFLRWIDENLHAAITGHDHPEPVGVLNDPQLTRDTAQVRWSGNNYFTAHMRNIGLMAMALDPADDPNNSLRGTLRNATGAWLYILDYLMRNDSRGGLLPEGFEYSPQTAGYAAQFFLALQTAGLDDPALYGPQVLLTGNPFWEEFINAYLHSLSTAPVNHPDFGQVFQPAWYGDGLNYWTPDFIGVFAPLGLYYATIGRAERAQDLRWVQTNLAPGLSNGLTERVRGAPFFLDAIFYFLLLDPTAAAPPDPRPRQALALFAPGLGRLLARTGWGTDATWFTYKLSWNQVDHQNADGNQLEFYRKGEWLTKERSGYDLDYGASLNHNTLTLENDPVSRDPGDFRSIQQQLGSQWTYVAAGDPRVLAYSLGNQFVYIEGDATALYNSTYENSTGIQHASRAILWMKPDHLIVYDRAASRTSGRFKRFWLNFATQAAVSGNRATVTTPAGQKLYVTSLLPAGAQLSSAAAVVVAGDVAYQEPMQFRLRVEAPGGPQSVRFLHVLQGADATASADATTLLQGTSGTAFEGVVVRNTATLFKTDLSAAFTGVTYSVPAATSLHYITDLTPNTGYRVVTQTAGNSTVVTVSPNGTDRFTDSGGVLELSSAAPGGPAVNSGGVVHGAHFGQSVAPGAIVSIFGANFSTSIGSASAVPLPRSLAGARVTMEGVDLPLFYVSPTQINAQLPFELAGQTRATVQVSAGSSASQPAAVNLSAVAPGIFTLSSDGQGAGAILHASSFAQVGPSNPATRGEVIAIYATGLGAVSPPTPTGSAPLSSAPSQTVQQPSVTIGGVPAEVQFSGLAPGFVGLYQINVAVPATAPTGDNVPVQVQIGNQLSNVATFAVSSQ